ncbi:hypothetical protein SAMN04488515_0958 [Cognatiyoonia koreensis]|uniref:Phosphatidate cytidylyltransferase n=1 Tax=Cognatiyoonia koreensis TaxID=364200 RepID=A0A1I0P250_9RHOB|nr:UDP-2,3-diacylglucosamine diphosphatase LpxI [Cognatiyoonia koreensis]SEW08058.1 hypothetical protein SAMN04488515_0958 [Cognatiyoonia koreensis]
MLALIAGTGDLPAAIIARLPTPPLVCALDGFAPSVPVDVTFRLEQLGSFLEALKARGVTEICMAGAVRRPDIDPAAIDPLTAPLVPRLQAAMAQGDDGALRAIIALLEEAGFVIVAAHEVAPDLLPPMGVLTPAKPSDWHRADATVGEACIAEMGAADIGQACIVRVGKVVAREGPDGTDAMLDVFCAPFVREEGASDPFNFVIDTVGDLIGDAADWLSGQDEDPVTADDGILFKAPKPAQDRRADLPLIGPGTAIKAAEAGLAGIVIEAGGVMVLDLIGVQSILDAQKMFLWVRPRGGR